MSWLHRHRTVQIEGRISPAGSIGESSINTNSHQINNNDGASNIAAPSTAFVSTFRTRTQKGSTNAGSPKQTIRFMALNDDWLCKLVLCFRRFSYTCTTVLMFAVEEVAVRN
jgi:hypothetical protein